MALEKFHYTHNGKKITLPRFDQALTFGDARRMQKSGEQDAVIFELIERVATKPALAIIDTMDLAAFGKFVEAWRSGGKVTAGESRASSS